MPVFDSTVPPEGEGRITLRIDTEGREGKLHKSARVYTNDPLRGVQVIHVKAVVKSPIHLSTPYLYFQGLSDSRITRSVEIRAEEGGGLALDPVSFNLDETLTYELEELSPGRLFRVKLSTIPGVSGSYVGKLKLKTNHPRKPLLTINIRVKIKKASGETAAKRP